MRILLRSGGIGRGLRILASPILRLDRFVSGLTLSKLSEKTNNLSVDKGTKYLYSIHRSMFL